MDKVIPSGSLLFDQFLLVCLKEDQVQQSYVPYVKEVYPSSQLATSNVSLFCFPEDIDRNSLSQIKTGASFFFVLTDVEGKQQIGYTRRIVSGASLPQCLCLLTHCSHWNRLFNRLLDEAENRLRESYESLHAFLDSLRAIEVPPPGGHITIAMRPPLMVVRPETGSLSYALYPLLSTFSSNPNAIIQIFASLLFERRIIVISSDLERISSCVETAVSALYPFAWHHIFIPVLPKQLLAYCSAPMPFLIGLHTSLLLPLQAMPLNEVVFVDLDREQVSSNPMDVANLPPTIIGPLRTTLEAATHSIKKTGSADYSAVAMAFMYFFVKIFAGYKRFFVKDLSRKPVRSTFDRETFITSQTKPVRKFLEGFCGSQMFERFIAEREDHEVTGLFEKEADDYFLLNYHNNNNNLKTIAVERLSYYGQKYSSVVRGLPFAFSISPASSGASNSLTKLPTILPPVSQSNINGQSSSPRINFPIKKSNRDSQSFTKPLPPLPPQDPTPSMQPTTHQEQPPSINIFNSTHPLDDTTEALALQPLQIRKLSASTPVGRPKSASMSFVPQKLKPNSNSKEGPLPNFQIQPPNNVLLPPVSMQQQPPDPQQSPYILPPPKSSSIPNNNSSNSIPNSSNSIPNNSSTSIPNNGPTSYFDDWAGPSFVTPNQTQPAAALSPSQGNIFTSFSLDDMLAPPDPIISKPISPSISKTADDEFDSFLASRHQV